MRVQFSIFLFPYLVLPIFCSKSDDFREELVIKPLLSGHLAANFRFVTRRYDKLDNHYDLFPKVIGELLNRYSVAELHLSLTQGHWRTSQWGYGIQPSAPNGAQVWAWFKGNQNNVSSWWPNLIQSLSGYFCASLSQMYPQLSASPPFGFKPTGALDGEIDAHSLRYAALASEMVCTENLTPWQKLLPCKETGLASLLNPVKLYHSHYHSIAVDVRRICEDSLQHCALPIWELSLSLVTVFDADIITRNPDWNLRSLFDARIDNNCPLAQSSDIYVDTSKQYPLFTPSPTSNISHFAHFNLLSPSLRPDSNRFFSLSSRQKGSYNFASITPPLINIHSYLGGVGLEYGRLVTRITNGDRRNHTALYSHLIPWFLRIYTHTLDIRCDGIPTPPQFRTYTPSVDRVRPHYLELSLSLPSKSSCLLSLEYDKAFLRWNEYPPDAHHGFWVPAAALTFRSNDRHRHNTTVPLGGYSTIKQSLESETPQSEVITIYGECLLVNLPTPDFSMPYNVICLVCTVVALCFGPIHNLTTRSLCLRHPDALKEQGIKAKVRKVLVKIKEKIVKMKEKFWKRKEETKDKTE